MNIEFLRKAGLVTAAFLISAVFALPLSAQIKIPLPIGKPTPKPLPQTVKNPPANVGGNAGAGASRQEVNAFMADLRDFEMARLKAKTGVRGGKGVRLLKNMADQSARG